MEATLKFDLNMPGEEELCRIHHRALDMHSLLTDMDEKMRTSLKHGHQFKTPEEVMKYIRELILEENLPER